ncbi:hypothetical protein AMS68_003194 [Peltaster fructicola]|uniref:Nucleotide-diphospho-sugar transferase n=1 Tax=Peltaster fructicola TaxID=286661 RepID=A0A6H0XSD9_9PEZI|nr:hypothetical protein AMS68_003194 [Peltaster fructicola]
MLDDTQEVPDDQDGYFVATRVLGYQLLHSKTAGTNSSIPFVVMCTSDVSERKRARLEKDGAKVIVVEGLSSTWMKPGDPRWADQLTKLRLFELTQYSKIAYMDSDILVTDRLDGVFYDEATLSQQTNAMSTEIKDDEAPLPRSYMLAAHADSWGYDHPFPPPADADYFNCGFLVFSPSKLIFDYYVSLLSLDGRFDAGMMEQNLMNYAHRKGGNMPWKPLWYGWNVNWATAKDYRGGARSFHAKYWDSDPSHDPMLKAMWKEQRAEMEGFYRGRELRDK